MGIEKKILPEPFISQLNAAHYKTLLCEAKIAAAERAMLDAKGQYHVALAERQTSLATVNSLIGGSVKTWEPSTGEADYEPIQAEPGPGDPSAELVNPSPAVAG